MWRPASAVRRAVSCRLSPVALALRAGDDGSDSLQLGGYHNNKKLFFHPKESSTFKLVKLNNVNVTFLDKTNLLGYDGQDMAKVRGRPERDTRACAPRPAAARHAPDSAVHVLGVQLGRYSVETRLGMITHCNSANFNDVDGIIGFGWANQNRSAAILKTLTQDGRPHWDIKRKPPTPRCLRQRAALTPSPPRHSARPPLRAQRSTPRLQRERAWPCVLVVTVRPLLCNRAPGVQADAAQVRVHGVGGGGRAAAGRL